MSKTFKALQRAARERAGRNQGQDAEAVPPGSSPDPELHVPEPHPSPSPALDMSDLAGESDPGLQEILKSAFVGGTGLIRVEGDGWVRGHLDEDAARGLLQKYALLHCLRQDESNSFWFWSSAKEARERAQRSRLPLDFE